MFENDRIQEIFHDLRSKFCVVDTYIAVSERFRKSADEKELQKAAMSSQASTMEMFEELHWLLKELRVISAG